MTHLHHFFGAYFHQDWSLDDPAWEAVVRRFRRNDGEAECGFVADELEALLAAEPSDEALRTIVHRELGCCYDARPNPGEPPLRTWLQQVVTELRKR